LEHCTFSPCRLVGARRCLYCRTLYLQSSLVQLVGTPPNTTSESKFLNIKSKEAYTQQDIRQTFVRRASSGELVGNLSNTVLVNLWQESSSLYDTGPERGVSMITRTQLLPLVFWVRKKGRIQSDHSRILGTYVLHDPSSALLKAFKVVSR
jgi:hypothetical protein